MEDDWKETNKKDGFQIRMYWMQKTAHAIQRIQNKESGVCLRIFYFLIYKLNITPNASNTTEITMYLSIS